MVWVAIGVAVAVFVLVVAGDSGEGFLYGKPSVGMWILGALALAGLVWVGWLFCMYAKLALAIAIAR